MTELDEAALRAWVARLHAGEVLACPTETQMGLLADARNPAAVARVARMKRRPPGEPIALLLPDFAALAMVTPVTADRAADTPGQAALGPAAEALARQHWPGPLTLIVPASPALPQLLVLDGTVGVRVPGPSPALALVRAFGGPLTATSANLSGQPTARDGDEARRIFGDQLAGVVPGSCPGGLPSTIVDARGDGLRVIRRGAIAV